MKQLNAELISKLKEGGIWLEFNPKCDDFVEDLQQVIKTAFPKDPTIPTGSHIFYMASRKFLGGWNDSDQPSDENKPTHPLQDFFLPAPNEGTEEKAKNCISQDKEYDIFPEGSFWIMCKNNHFLKISCISETDEDFVTRHGQHFSKELFERIGTKVEDKKNEFLNCLEKDLVDCEKNADYHEQMVNECLQRRLYIGNLIDLYKKLHQ